MALFFSGAVTSSPVKRRLRRNQYQSLDTSFVSPDSSYVCYSSADAAGSSCCCRRSPRLLTNGYYAVTEDSFSLDEDGNVSLLGCRTNVSYKENLVRVFRRRRRPRSALARLLSGVTETCQSWLDQKVFGGVFGTRQNQDWTQSSQEGPSPLDESLWADLSGAELDDDDDGCSFTYDPTQVPPPPDKEAPPPKIFLQEEICSEICQSKEGLGGLSEVPPPSPYYTNSCCCQTSPEPTGLTMKTLLLLIFTVFILTTLFSGCWWWSSSVTSAVFVIVVTFMILTKSGPLGEWRRAKTEDITSNNE